MSAQKKSAKLSASFLSMTGYGKGSASSSQVQIELEIRSINHRFLDFGFKLPRAYNPFEPELRSELSRRLERGRIEVAVQRQSQVLPETAASQRKSPPTVSYFDFNPIAFDELLVLHRTLRAKVQSKYQDLDNLQAQSLVTELVSKSEVLTARSDLIQADQEKQLLLKALSVALDSLQEMRLAEGANLRNELQARKDQLVNIRVKIAVRASGAASRCQEQLISRIKKLVEDSSIDRTRLELEIALQADRLDITEELVRLLSHFDQFDQAMERFPQGKRLDFLLQELGREFNTIGSKAQDAEIQSLVVEAKVNLEKMREQVQNVV